MSTEKMKEIKINADTWSKLKDIRERVGCKKWSATIKWLLDHQSSSEEGSTQEINHEKLLQDLIGERTWRRIDKMRTDHGFDSFSRLLDHFVDCHNVLQQESLHKKLEGKDALQEIHDHIRQLKPPQPLEENNTTNISSISGEHNDIPADTPETSWLVCPICWHSVPLWVKNPEDKPGRGIIFKTVDGSLARRFIGINEKYMPLEVRRGDEVIVENSMAISTLKRLDRKLFDDFLKIIENTRHGFTGGVW